MRHEYQMLKDIRDAGWGIQKTFSIQGCTRLTYKLFAWRVDENSEDGRRKRGRSN